MAKGVNKWIGIGNACADPDTRYLPNGGAVSNVNIACNDSYKNKETGQVIDTTEFVRVVFFNRLAEIVNEYVKKGAKLYVEGSLRTRSWEQDGIKRYATEIVAKEIQMLDGKSDSGQNSQQAQRPAQNSQQAPQQSAPQASSSFDNFDDSIPF